MRLIPGPRATFALARATAQSSRRRLFTPVRAKTRAPWTPRPHGRARRGRVCRRHMFRQTKSRGAPSPILRPNWGTLLLFGGRPGRAPGTCDSLTNSYPGENLDSPAPESARRAASPSTPPRVFGALAAIGGDRALIRPLFLVFWRCVWVESAKNKASILRGPPSGLGRRVQYEGAPQ